MNIDISTPEKKQEILDLFKSFSYKKEILEYYNVCNNTQNRQYVEHIANQIGFDFSYYKEKRNYKKYCLYCGLEITGKDKSRKNFATRPVLHHTITCREIQCQMKLKRKFLML